MSKGMNCFSTVMYFLGYAYMPNGMDFLSFGDWYRTNTYEIKEKDLKPGDIVIITANAELTDGKTFYLDMALHAAIYQGNGMWYEKMGYNHPERSACLFDVTYPYRHWHNMKVKYYRIKEQVQAA